MGQWGPVSGFWESENGPLAPLRIRRPMLGRKACFLCLVVLSVSVESGMECGIRDRDMFCAVSLSGAMWSAMSVPLGNRLGRPRKP